MQVRPITGKPRQRYRFWRRLFMFVLRWTFIVIGAIASAVFVFAHIYRVNEAIYDPSLFAIGVGGLFSMLCGVMLMVMSRNSRLRLELRGSKARCEQLADYTWELKEAEARAASLLETQGDVIIRRDSDNRITYVNDAYCALAGDTREALLGSARALQVLEQGTINILADGARVHDQNIMTAGGPRWLSWRDVVVRPKPDNGAEVQSVGRDVTNRAQTERALAEARDAAEAANVAKSRFLAMVSHEIRTPLNGILGMTDLLLDTPLTQEQTAYVKATKTSGETLLSLIEDILDFSKIEAGRLELVPQPFSLATLVEEVVELLAPRAHGKGLHIASDVDERLTAPVLGDANRVRQVLLNLAGNAIKFTEAGSVGVVVEPGVEPDQVLLTVRDTGVGIAPDLQARIFREFEQADGGAARKFGGTGLGLAISRRIVERMGGRIEVASTPGEGSTFRVMLTLPQASNAGVPAPPHLAGKAVLIVAPRTIEAVLLMRRLERWGAIVQLAEASAAASMLSGRRWDTLLVDHSVVAEIASFLEPAGQVIPRRIVLITPAERHRLPALKKPGFTGYLVKPVRAASLRAQLLAGETLTDDRVEHSGATVEAGNIPLQPSAGESARSLSILVAEDNEINALLTRSLLSKLGHRPTVASSGAEAVDRWLTAHADGAPYDLVVMDVHMPGIDGLEAARRIRAVEAGMPDARTPIIALTANAFAEDRDACIAAGMDGFLVKPLSRERLAAALTQVSGTQIAA
jgi:PAS domain S-box-containing protein